MCYAIAKFAASAPNEDRQARMCVSLPTWKMMLQPLPQLKKGLSRTRLSDAPRSSGADRRGRRVVSTGITLISLGTNVFGRPWGGEQSQGWRDAGGGRENGRSGGD